MHVSTAIHKMAHILNSKDYVVEEEPIQGKIIASCCDAPDQKFFITILPGDRVIIRQAFDEFDDSNIYTFEGNHKEEVAIAFLEAWA